MVVYGHPGSSVGKHVENETIKDTCKLNTIVLAIEKQDLKSKKLS